MRTWVGAFSLFFLCFTFFSCSTNAKNQNVQQNLENDIFAGNVFADSEGNTEWNFLTNGTVIRYSSDILSFSAGVKKQELYSYSYNESKQELYLKLLKLKDTREYSKPSQYINANKKQIQHYISILLKNTEADKQSKKEYKQLYDEYFSSNINNYFNTQKTYIYKINNDSLYLYRFIDFDKELGNLVCFASIDDHSYEIDIADDFISFIRLEQPEEQEVLYRGALKYDAEHKKFSAILYKIEQDAEGNFVDSRKVGTIEGSVEVEKVNYEVDGYIMQKCGITFTKIIEEIPFANTLLEFTSQFWTPAKI